MTIDEICKRLGIYRKTFTTALKTLDLCEQYKRSDYGDQFKSAKFSVFQEVVKSPAIRKWLVWEEGDALPSNNENLLRLFSWLSYEHDIDTDSDELADGQTREPIVITAAQIRELSQIIGDPKAIENLERTKNLSTATLSSESFVRNKVDDGLTTVEQSVNQLFSLLTYQIVETTDASVMLASLVTSGRR